MDGHLNSMGKSLEGVQLLDTSPLFALDFSRKECVGVSLFHAKTRGEGVRGRVVRCGFIWRKERGSPNQTGLSFGALINP